MDSIVIIGASGHAKVIADIVRLEGKYHIEGLIDAKLAPGSDAFGYQVLGHDEHLPELVVKRSIRGAIVAVGHNFRRSQIHLRVSELCPGLTFVNAIHPAAHLAKHASVGGGTAIMAGAVVNACCSIGRSCILNTNSSLDHDCRMENFSSLAPGVSVGGNCQIGQLVAVCIGATVVHKVSIGRHSVIGAGATVLRDIPPRTVAYGTPAKLIRARKPEDEYL